MCSAGDDLEGARRLVDQREEAHQVDLAALGLQVVAHAILRADREVLREEVTPADADRGVVEALAVLGRRLAGIGADAAVGKGAAVIFGVGIERSAP